MRQEASLWTSWEELSSSRRKGPEAAKSLFCVRDAARTNRQEGSEGRGERLAVKTDRQGGTLHVGL